MLVTHSCTLYWSRCSTECPCLLWSLFLRNCRSCLFFKYSEYQLIATYIERVFSPKTWFEYSTESLSFEDFYKFLMVISSCTWPTRRMWRYSAVLTSRSFMDFMVAFRSVIHLELIFMCSVWSGSGSFCLLGLPLYSGAVCWKDSNPCMRLCESSVKNQPCQGVWVCWVLVSVSGTMPCSSRRPSWVLTLGRAALQCCSFPVPWLC